MTCRDLNVCHFPIKHSRNGTLFGSHTQYTHDSFYFKIHAHEYSTWNDSRVTSTITINRSGKRQKKKTALARFFPFALYQIKHVLYGITPNHLSIHLEITEWLYINFLSSDSIGHALKKLNSILFFSIVMLNMLTRHST